MSNCKSGEKIAKWSAPKSDWVCGTEQSYTLKSSTSGEVEFSNGRFVQMDNCKFVDASTDRSTEVYRTYNSDIDIGKLLVKVLQFYNY